MWKLLIRGKTSSRNTLGTSSDILFRRGISIITVSLLLCAFVIPLGSTGAVEEDDYYDSYEADDEEEAETTALVVVPEKRREERQLTSEYYDFVITEYSYKIWVVFMIYAMICVFYACLVAAYFAETNTLAPTQAFDYDYVIRRSAGEEEEEVLDVPPNMSKEVMTRILRGIESNPHSSSLNRTSWTNSSKGGDLNEGVEKSRSRKMRRETRLHKKNI